MINKADELKNGWFIKDAKNGTSAVSGSPSQYTAPTATHNEVTRSKIRHLIADGCAEDIISVSLLSNAFKSSQATCSNDILQLVNSFFNVAEQ